MLLAGSLLSSTVHGVYLLLLCNMFVGAGDCVIKVVAKVVNGHGTRKAAGLCAGVLQVLTRICLHSGLKVNKGTLLVEELHAQNMYVGWA